MAETKGMDARVLFVQQRLQKAFEHMKSDKFTKAWNDADAQCVCGPCSTLPPVADLPYPEAPRPQRANAAFPSRLPVRSDAIHAPTATGRN
jgi:hypothetical protein